MNNRERTSGGAYRINCLRILELQAIVENITKRCFHEIDAELDELCVQALDGEIHASFVINRLAKLVDSLEGGLNE